MKKVIGTGIDAGVPFSVASLKAFANRGVSFVGRYVKSNSWKTLNAAEAKAILDNGMQILSVFERTADRTKGGSLNGVVDGKEAYSHCKSLGQPEGTAIYFAVDYDAPASQFDNIESYLRAAKDQIGKYKLGVYGSYSVCEAMAARFPGIYIWQTRAWSKGKISDKAHVYQRQIDVKAEGVLIDWNDLLEPDAGLWGGKKQSPPAIDKPETPAELPKIVGVTYVDEGKKQNQGQGYLIKGRTYVPIRQIADLFSVEVKYANKKAWIKRGDGWRAVTDSYLKDGVTYIQARAFAEGYSGAVTWDEDRKVMQVIRGLG